MDVVLFGRSGFQHSEREAQKISLVWRVLGSFNYYWPPPAPAPAPAHRVTTAESEAAQPDASFVFIRSWKQRKSTPWQDVQPTCASSAELSSETDPTRSPALDSGLLYYIPPALPKEHRAPRTSFSLSDAVLIRSPYETMQPNRNPSSSCSNAITSSYINH